LALVLCVSSCSFMNARGPSEPPGRPCTEHYELPVLDTVGAIGSGLITAAAIAALADPCSGTRQCTERGQAGLIVGIPALSVTAVMVASAWTGYHRVAACRGARSDITRRGTP
jgi:hypothetical protein